jgi:hypothetical protein
MSRVRVPAAQVAEGLSLSRFLRDEPLREGDSAGDVSLREAAGHEITGDVARARAGTRTPRRRFGRGSRTSCRGSGRPRHRPASWKPSQGGGGRGRISPVDRSRPPAAHVAPLRAPGLLRRAGKVKPQSRAAGSQLIRMHVAGRRCLAAVPRAIGFRFGMGCNSRPSNSRRSHGGRGRLRCSCSRSGTRCCSDRRSPSPPAPG